MDSGDASVQLCPPVLRLLSLILLLGGDFVSVKFRDDIFPHVFTLLQYFLHLHVKSRERKASNASGGVRSHETACEIALLKFLIHLSDEKSLRSVMRKDSLKFAWLIIQFHSNEKVIHSYLLFFK